MDWEQEKDNSKRPSRHDDPHHHLRSPLTWILVGGVVLLFLFLFIGIPAMKGYNVYKAMKASGVPDEYITDMQSLASRLQELEREVEAANGQRDSANSQLATCTTEKQSIQEEADAQVARIDKTLAICSSDVNKAKSDLDSCEQDLEDTVDIIADAGRRLCCVARVNDASITGYDIKGDKIVCVSEGGTAISC